MFREIELMRLVQPWLVLLKLDSRLWTKYSGICPKFRDQIEANDAD